MPARTLEEIRKSLEKGPVAERFAAGFAEIYLSQALGVLPKAEIDLLVFRLLVEAKLIDPNGPIFVIARALNITPAKARNLVFQYQLRFLASDQSDAMVFKALAAARYSVDETRLSFGIESPLARAAIEARLKERGIFADISLSGEVLRVPLEHFGEFVLLLMSDEKAKALEKALKADGYLKGTKLQAFLKKYGTEVAKGGANAAGRSALSDLWERLSRYSFSGEGAPEIGQLFDGLG